MAAKTAAARPAAASEPGRDCPLCPRLVEFREEWRANEPGWHNAPVPAFGPVDAPLLIVGLAPGLRGANRTGRPFTGDYAGDLLYATLIEYGFARGPYAAHPEDGLALTGARIVNAVRCVPPQNKPTPEEIRTCRPFLSAAMAEMPALRAIVTLGKIAHDSTLAALGQKASRLKFGHGVSDEVGSVRLFASYHCSRYNTNTGVLTPEMFRSVFSAVRASLG
ncbi:uracil-DNA glycosylase family 4 [Xanthobacter flavus]|nr:MULTISPECIES: uracil-DNA glycosylase [Xanthobacter]MDR6332564.1 uracil-DNA glycosylase family 4 [Xanthobacter flavus]NMN56778.1 uracil-DNA glycosylase family 4 [Xanthobacter sp. SG618]UDQ89305.1 uracil-DNA glycosylase [Xanthobacter autotrophicus]